MSSPYANYATYITEISVAERDVAILHFIEQKALDIILSMIILMTAPLFLEAYCYESMPEIRKTIWGVMLASVANAIIQLVLQICGYKDFIEMSVVSHGIIVLLILVNVVTIGKVSVKKRVWIYGLALSECSA